MITKIRLFITSTRFKITFWYSSLFLFLEILLGLSIYGYFYHTANLNLDGNLKAQAKSIYRIFEEKHVDFESFVPGAIYKTEDEFIWDVIYDAIVFNRRNTYVQISRNRKILFKTANLGDVLIDSKSSTKEILFTYRNDKLSTEPIRVCKLNGKRFSIMVAYPLEHISQTLNWLRDIYIIIAPVFFFISMLGGALISNKSLSRIDAIIKKTDEITAQNLNEIITGGEYNDEYGRLVKKMNQMIARIKTSVDFMNQFSISAAHELKTPLTILLGETELALKSPKTSERYIETLKSNYEETIRMIKIVDNLFFISKSDNSLLKLNLGEVDLDSFLTMIVKKFRTLGEEKNMRLIIEECSAGSFLFDQDLIRQALSNLIDNAFKYGYENSTVKITGVLADTDLKIAVTNYGDKIAEEDVEKIFDRFFRSEKSRNRKSGGVGLGLSVVKSIVTLHKGTVDVQSGNDDTTKVTITIPADPGKTTELV